eukprot:XP_011675673.1 PREDICTED: uncharacterized protein LOC105443776 [Strongylocentrotus purpuratus]
MHSWKSVQELAARACSSLDVTCAISAITMAPWDLPTLTKVTLIEGQRPLNRRYCCEETLEDCSMTYRTVNGTEDIIIGASRHREVRFQGTGLLLSTLLKLNLVGSSLERLVVPLLEMDYCPERLARNILVTNEQLMIHSEYSLVTPDEHRPLRHAYSKSCLSILLVVPTKTSDDTGADGQGADLALRRAPISSLNSSSSVSPFELTCG